MTNNTIPCLDSLSEKKTTKASKYDIADSLNKFFINNAGELTKDIEPFEQISVSQVEISLFLYKASNLEISKIIDQLDNKSSSVDDNISNLVVKQSKIEIVPFLTFLINKSFRDGVFPEALKKSEVLPLFKEGSKTKERNYRPISLLNMWSKIFERAMFNRMSLYLERFCLI